MQISAGQPEPGVEHEVGKRRVFVLAGAPEESLDGLQDGFGGDIDDDDFVIDRGEPGIGGHQHGAEDGEGDGHARLESNGVWDFRIGRGGNDLVWIAGQSRKRLTRNGCAVKQTAHPLEPKRVV